MRPLISAAVPAVLMLVPAAAAANDRAFTYTYESAVLPAGAHELELWTTARLGRDGGSYRRYDQRIEVEAGLTDRLMGAFYLNAETVHTDAGTASVLSGVSWEMKYKHLDASADAVGLATYLEVSHGPDESELEAKLIVDKRLDGWLWATNLVLEEEFKDLGGENELEHKFELDLALAFELGEVVTLGLEIRGQGVIEEGEFQGLGLYAGPAIGARGKAMWATLSVLPQLGTVAGEAGGFKQDLVHREQVQGRLLVGFDF